MSKWAYKKDLDVSHIDGNASTEAKRFGLAILHLFIGTKSTSFGADIGQYMNWTEMNIHKQGQYTFAETVFEVTVYQDMCNIHRILHGACAAYIVDLCTNASLVSLGTAEGFDGTGVSQFMNLVWHHPIHLGKKIKVVSTSVSGKGRLRTMRCELWTDGQICVSAVHSTVNVAIVNAKL
ncbi:hypothetical protein JR316_0004366 [Psilocybe cubensis]|uniref:Thioesterase domain-containing protein n=2 Tax=Psilocybe cubensis TaxID=181762 RepID=A0A8H7XVU8_PSICU|nr:hypothetical protein JR316_0004366 [Psilocybe cubensis]KAH9482268.1 hypothetical protein JR316_0004366 [Psilocybe cubensis]